MSTLLQRKKDGGKRKYSIPSTTDQILNVKDLIIQLSQANTIDVLYALGHSPKSWTSLLQYFGMTRKQSGHLGHFVRICINNKLIQKDSRLDAFHLTFKGKVCLDFLKSIEKFANNTIETPYHHQSIPELRLDMERPWLEVLLTKELRKAIKTTREATK